MKSFYFTYGTSEKMPFKGGWTEVIAETREQAVNLFNAVHTPRTPGIVNCAFIYSEDEFKETEMYKQGINLGAALQETISIKRYE